MFLKAAISIVVANSVYICINKTKVTTSQWVPFSSFSLLSIDWRKVFRVVIFFDIIDRWGISLEYPRKMDTGKV